MCLLLSLDMVMGSTDDQDCLQQEKREISWVQVSKIMEEEFGLSFNFAQCRERFTNVINPNLDIKELRRPWTVEQTQHVKDYMSTFKEGQKPNWTQFAKVILKGQKTARQCQKEYIRIRKGMERAQNS